MAKGRIYGVALGPGDPDLITLKALKVLQAADVIYYPTTINSKGESNSMAMRVLKHQAIDLKKALPVEVAMKYKRAAVTKTYKKLAADSIELSQQGKQVAIVSEGDISFYSTFAYLIDDFNKANVDYEMIPGVPAFILAGALSASPICTQTDEVLVMPDVESEEQLKTKIASTETVVLMKVSKVKEWIAEFLASIEVDFFYGEFMGTDKEFTTRNIYQLKGRRIPYFSIIIIKAKHKEQ
ncbi:precorrin-2 C(20)-methyltransferase [Carboxylicivirga marina]|uniref:precorrin-2 C(20)-methyltransferase n=1 Tax=Carboxylicivirga marina TaxID=2800988 RepID=UPI00259682B6|nr:precorrin-2 C(20)-methyltransferase [uncultured Carboxylicivirga sp.]